MSKPIILPEYCGHYSFEKLMLDRKKVVKGESVEFDFRELKWIGLLPLSLLFDWILDCHNSGARVHVRFSELDVPPWIFQTLARMGFISALQKAGIDIVGNIPRLANSGVAAFHQLSSEGELLAYEHALENIGEVDSLLGGGADIEIINSGYLREILLHELGDNAFRHGKSKSVRILVAELKGRSKPDQGGFEVFFDGRDTVEIAVSDDGQGLLTRLGKVVPENWVPEYARDQRLSRGAITCAYALEFGSTSSPGSRKKRLEEIFDGVGDFAKSIPTGLFYVASLARHYAGQLILRTASNSVSFNYSDPNSPKIVENPIRKQGAEVNGTHILIRLPRDAKAIQPGPQQQELLPAISVDGAFEEIALEECWLSTGSNPSAFILHLEHKVENILTQRPIGKRHALVLLADGFSAETKVIALFLTWLGTIPHRGWRIVVCGLGEEHFEAAVRQSQEIKRILHKSSATHHRLHAWKPFLLTDAQSKSFINFGDGSLPTLAPDSVMAWHTQALERVVRRMLEHPHVSHLERPNRYYLIEGKYYTQKFYEIRQLTSHQLNQLGAWLSVALVAHWIRKSGAKTVFTLAEPLSDFVALLKTFVHDVNFIIKASMPDSASFLVALLRCQDKKFMLLTDVVCTGNQFQSYFDKLTHLENCSIATFVDGRKGKLQHITQDKATATYRINVFATLRTQIKFFNDLPHEENVEILIIDRKTHAPTPRYEIGEFQLGTLELVSIAHNAGALYHGHTSLGAKHYVDLIDLPRLFQAIQVQLEGFWSTTLQTLQHLMIDPRDVLVYYLQENRGWEQIVPQFMSTRVAKCREINRNKLLNPPDYGADPVSEKCMWFILPVIASGETVRQCLEYASRKLVGDKCRIVISAVIGRMEPAELSFYQHIQKYKGSSTLIQTFSFLPLPAYRSKNECRICIMLRMADSNAQRVERFERISDHYHQARNEIAAQDVPSAPMKLPLSGAHDAIFSQMNLLYWHGKHEVQKRKKLAEMLDMEEGNLRFIEMVGSHYDLDNFSEGNVRVRLYTRYEPLQEAARKILHSTSGTTLSLQALLGIHILFPSLLETELVWLMRRAAVAGDDVLVSRLVFFSLLIPETYGVQLAIAAHVSGLSTCKYAGLFKELRNCTLWFGVHAGRAIEAFEELLWLLRRSTDWGSGIEEFRTMLQTPSGSDPKSLKANYHKFEVSAIDAVLRKVAIMKDCDNGMGLWSAIRAEGNDPDCTVENIAFLAEEMRRLIHDIGGLVQNKLLDLLDDLDLQGQTLLEDLESIFTNVRDVIGDVSALARWPTLKKSNVKVKFEVAGDQPGVLFGYGHLSSALNAILENVDKFIRENYSKCQTELGDLEVIFRFLGHTDTRDAAILEIQDNVPYKNPLVLQGGLKQLDEHCKAYGTKFYYGNNLLSDNSNIHMRFHFRINLSGRVDE